MAVAVVAEAWETLKHAIEAYTGLSVATFFTVLAVAAAFYYAVAGFLQPPPPPPMRNREEELEGMEPLQPPVQLGEISEEELKAYDGTNPKKPLLMAIKGQVYDVTQSRMFYGPGGPYALFAGKDASRALAKMSFEPKDLTGDISGLGPFELEALQDWEYKFMSKYVKVGTIKKAVPVSQESDTSTFERKEAAQTTDRYIQVANDAPQTEEDGPAELEAEVERSSELKEEDSAQGHDDEAEHTSQEKDDALGHVDEEKHTTQLEEHRPSSTQGEEPDHAKESKGVSEGDSAKE